MGAMDNRPHQRRPRPPGFAALAAALLLVLALVLAGCGARPRPPAPAAGALREVPESEWPILYDDSDAASLHQAAMASVAYLRRLPPGRAFSFGTYKVGAGELADALTRLADLLWRLPDPVARTEALKRDFILMESVGRDGDGDVLYTGYYEPVLAARRRPQPPFVYPLYALPSDWVTIDLSRFGKDLPAKRLIGQVEGHKVVPYPDREAIDWGGAVAGKAEVLAYLADPVEAFFFHVQGSGQVRFADGSRLRLGYAGQNGRPYRSIGRMMIDEGMLERHAVSMQSIKSFLAEHPDLRRRVLSHNPSYVFFRPLPAEGGPLGCYEVPLTAGRSIATDRRVFPGLAMAYLVTEAPVPGGGTGPLMRFALNQDTGGAIRGPGRVDIFFGSGDQAGELAGRMKNQGRLYFLLPRGR